MNGGFLFLDWGSSFLVTVISRSLLRIRQEVLDLLVTIRGAWFSLFLFEVVDIGEVYVNAVERAANTVAAWITKVDIADLRVYVVILPIWSRCLINVL